MKIVNFENIAFESIVENIIGKKVTSNTLDIISTRIDIELLRQSIKPLKLKSEEFISMFENNQYFLQAISSIQFDAVEACSCIKDMKEIILPAKNTLLDLSFSLQQYRECLNMLKRYSHNKYSYQNIKNVIISDVGLFVSSFDSSISDTFNRDYFIDKLNA